MNNINIKCICKNYLSENICKIMDKTKSKNKLVVVFPCSHIFHKYCLERLRSIGINSCLLCKKKINKVLSKKDIKKIYRETKDPKMYKLLVDLTCVKNTDHMGSINFDLVLLRSTDIMEIINKIYNINSSKDVQEGCDFILNKAKIKINIINPELINRNEKKIYISNHHNYIDPIILHSVLGCNFLSAPFFKNFMFLKQIEEYLPILVVKRGSNKSTVDKINKFVNKNGSICIFPEGTITHYRTLAKFRTGAFRTHYPVQPVIIKYKPNILHNDPKKFLLKLMSQKCINVDVKILNTLKSNDLVNNIENIRNMMGYEGNFALSRISNRDISD